MIKRILLFALVFGLVSLNAFAHTVILTWSPSSDGAANPTSGYNVLRGTAAGGESSTPINSSPVAAACTNTTTCTYTDSSSAVIAGATLYYEVTFVIGSISSVPSNEAKAGVPVASPSGLTAIGN